MKLSVSLSDDDVALLDAYARTPGFLLAPRPCNRPFGNSVGATWKRTTRRRGTSGSPPTAGSGSAPTPTGSVDAPR